MVASVLLLIRAGLRAPPRVPGLRLSKAPLQVKRADTAVRVTSRPRGSRTRRLGRQWKQLQLLSSLQSTASESLLSLKLAVQTKQDYDCTVSNS